MTTLDDLLSPRSVAIVGASDDPRRIGGRPLSYLLRHGFEGDILPVNPTRDEVQGLRTYPSLADIDQDVDFVLVAVKASLVPDVVEQAVARRAKTCMIFSSGFAEIGPVGQALQDEVVETARAGGVRLIGPNCLGVFNAATGFYPTFTGAVVDPAAPTGIAIASQSGAYGSHIYVAMKVRGLGCRYWLTTGNEADLETAEAIELLVEDDDVQMIAAYAESVKDGARLCRALEAARAACKPVVFMKVGRSEAGARAANSHTASMAGEDAIYDAVLRQYGAVRARTTDEMLDILYAAQPRIYPAGRRLGLVTISGGGGVLMADAAEEAGLDLVEMPEAAQAALKELVPFAAPRNPVDVTAQFFNDLSLVTKFIRMMLEEGGYDALVGFWTSVAGSPLVADEFIVRLRDGLEGFDDRLIIHSLIAPPEIQALYEAQGSPCFEDPSRAVVAMAALMRFGEAFARPASSTPPTAEAEALPAGALSEQQAKEVLAAAGLPMVADILATTAAEAEMAAAKFGLPCAFKIASPDIQHKTDVGGVSLGVGVDEAAGAFNAMMERAAFAADGAQIDGVLVSPMVDEGVECILGVVNDPVFGPVVMFGLGGVFAEVLNDVAFRRAPFDRATAREMIDEIRGRKMLDGVRGQPAADISALADAASRLSIFAATHQDEIESVEMNPIRALPDKAIALDALIVKRRG